MASSKLFRRSFDLVKLRRYSTIPGDLWTSGNVVISPYKNIDIPNSTITEHLWKNLDKWADKTALICGITKRSYTYHQLQKYSRNFAANLRTKLKISDGDVVCIMLHNSPEFAIVTYGILEAGGQVTTINPIYTPHEIKRQLDLSQPKVIIGSTETVPVIKEAFNLMKSQIPIVCASVENALPPGTISLKEFAFNDVDLSVLREVRVKSEDIALLPYSSGTTGLPKGVELTHKNTVVNCVQQDVDGVKLHQDTTGYIQDSIIAILPFYHTYALSVVMIHKLTVGARVVTVPKFKPYTFLNTLKEEKISLLYAAPPLILFLASNSDAKKEHLQYIDKIMCGAAPLPKTDVELILKKTKPGTDFLQLYGLTETSPLATAMPPGSTDYAASGVALPNTELKVVDSNLNALGPNETGELLIRGPQVMKGYRNNPEATKNAFTTDGWFKTGDLCALNPNGTVVILDRLKELIKVKGYQVPPAELETVLKEHPSVLDACVIGVKDQRKGEIPKAFVVLKSDDNVGSGEIADFINGRVADYKKIKDVVILDSLPKNPSGKLLRRVIRDKYT